MDIEGESGVGGDDRRRALPAIAERGRDCKSGPLSQGEFEQALIPPLDDIANANLELEEGVALAGGVEDAAGGEGACVVDAEGITFLGEGDAVSLLNVGLLHLEGVWWRGKNEKEKTGLRGKRKNIRCFGFYLNGRDQYDSISSNKCHWQVPFRCLK